MSNKIKETFKNLKEKYSSCSKQRKMESEQQYQAIIDKLNEEINQTRAEITKISAELENL